MQDKNENEIFRKGFSELFKVFKIDLGITEHWTNNVFYGPLVILPEIEYYVEVLESKVSEQIERFGKIDESIDYNSIQSLFAELRYDNLISVRMGLDFSLELKEKELFVTEDRYPSLWLAFVIIPGDKGYGLDEENHNKSGYHIHYIELQNKKRIRTDVTLTFDPLEPTTAKVDTDKLYWFYHGTGKYNIHHNPDTFGIKRKKAIYDCSIYFLGVISKKDFMTPPIKSAILYP